MKKKKPPLDPRVIELGKDKPHPGPESKLQESTALFLAYKQKVRALHVPNERGFSRQGFPAHIKKLISQRIARRVSLLKKEGYVPGASDWVFMYPQMAIELKVKNGELSADQIIFLNSMVEVGIPAYVIWNFDEFERVVNDHLRKI
jgi:hypothetical protein